jgi:hypothetical protein
MCRRIAERKYVKDMTIRRFFSATIQNQGESP